MKNLALIFSLFITTLMFSQQQGTVAGTILDKELNNEPLLFANINIKNTPTTVQTNFHGNFEIHDINPGNYTLVVSYLGYETIEVPIIIEENKTTQIINGLETKKINLQDIARLQRVSEEPAYITANSEQSSRK
ncbi:carboxypeptidase-like regulatory domain-containing protein [uncultured Eudoraea sp.]|uniref:carboxypeptidase-like regulatory domain-containing protein n=1 Tax=uncultured Eudoraea sp. TaxID=1035614 RepID=UPI00261D100C|nr:carboxypeptidase-like regulatory domain-containing protein [uncultured Eudoraea sp.]